MKIMEEIQVLPLRKSGHLLEKLKIRGGLERTHRKTGESQCFCTGYSPHSEVSDLCGGLWGHLGGTVLASPWMVCMSYTASLLWGAG